MNTNYSIWKYPLDITDNQTLKMPKGAKILSIQNQTHSPTIWALVDTEAELETRYINCYGTGHYINEDLSKLNFIGTVQSNNNLLVFHFFEKLV